MPLAADFFDPDILNGQGQPTTVDPVTGLTTTDIGAVLKGDADVNAQAEDVQVVNEVRNLLFNEVVPGVGFGQDLIALDIERGRSNGIGSYNQVRVALGLPAVTSFAQITSNVQVQNELEQAYGNVNNIDAFEGGSSRDPVPGSDCRPLVPADHCRPVHQPPEWGSLLLPERAVHSRASRPSSDRGDTLAKVIEANTGITNLQSDVFTFKASISGTVSLAKPESHSVSSRSGMAGMTVELANTQGTILATTTTNRQGHWTFSQQSGPAANPVSSPGVSGTGCYDVVLALPPSMAQMSAPSHPILISRGSTSVRGMNFVVAPRPLLAKAMAPIVATKQRRLAPEA